MGRDGSVTTQTTTQILPEATAGNPTTRPAQRGRLYEIRGPFPKPRLSLSAKVRSYLLPLPYRPPGERSISSFVRWSNPSRPINPFRSRDVRFQRGSRRSGRERQSPYYRRVLDVTANPLVGFPSAHRVLISIADQIPLTETHAGLRSPAGYQWAG